MNSVRDAIGRLRPCERLALLAALVVTTIYGGGKGVYSAGADAGIELAGITAEYDSTNDVTAVEVAFSGGSVTTNTPVSVRNDASENWLELEKIGATVTSGLATNVLSFAVSGNVSTNRFWWVGTETPAVIIETTGITITNYVATSKSVRIDWTCDDPKATVFALQRQIEGEAQFETVTTTTANSITFGGFTVGKTTKWRITSTYTEGNQ